MLRTRNTKEDNWFEPDELEATPEVWDFPLERKRARKRVALTTTLIVLFFAGAAFTAGAGDLASKAVEGDNCAQQANAPALEDESCAASADAAAAAPAEAVPADAAPADAAAPAPQAAAAPAQPSVSTAITHASTAAQSAPSVRTSITRTSAAAPAAAPAGAGNAAGAPSSTIHRRTAPQQSSQADRDANAEPVLKTSLPPAVPLAEWQSQGKNRPSAPAPEIEEGDGQPTVWLNRALPDPTPATRRLTGRFATTLTAGAQAHGLDWAFVLGVLRASGETGPQPASAGEIRRLTTRLTQLGAAKNEWQAALALDGHTEFADRAIALANYNRAVGLWALVHGLEAAKDAMTERILNDPQITIYSGGRSDLAQNRVDVRVVALIAYLHEAFGQVTVSCLISGHKLYARPGVISAHIYGLAVDIAALGGTTIVGHQQPGSVTEAAVRDILLLPSELQPRQVISLLGLGGPSFPLANHYDHIHIGY
jgi:hypothetical protein